MMYNELLALTDGKATYEQFLDVEDVYMSRESMTKLQAAALWKRRYGPKENKPRADELRRIKESIKDFKEERQNAAYAADRIRKSYDEQIRQYAEDCGQTLADDYFCEDWYTRQFINTLISRRDREISNLYDEWGLDSSVYIIYKDGSTCHAFGAEIVAGDISPRMQHIAYAFYGDGWTEFDTEIGEFPWDCSEDDQCCAKEEYTTSVEIKFRTEFGIRLVAKEAACVG